MNAVADPFPVVKIASPAVDAFDIEEVLMADVASSPVVNVAGKNDVEFDDEVTIDGRTTDVKVLYANEYGEIDVYRLNKNAEPVEPEISHWLSVKDYERLFGDAEEQYFIQEDEKHRAAYEDRQDRECHETRVAKACWY